MKFLTTKQRNEYFDNVISLYHASRYEEAEKLIQALDNKDERDLLYYVYGLDKNIHLYSFILDAVF